VSIVIVFSDRHASSYILSTPPAHAGSMSDAISSAGMVVYMPDSVSCMSSVTMAKA
jgi:hypothetical protein